MSDEEYKVVHFITDLGFDEVIVDGEDLQVLRQYLKKCEKNSNKIAKIKENLKEIIITGYDYDGFNNSEDLKKLIDEFVQIADETINMLGDK